jgi:hypothetical protein
MKKLAILFAVSFVFACGGGGGGEGSSSLSQPLTSEQIQRGTAASSSFFMLSL